MSHRADTCTEVTSQSSLGLLLPPGYRGPVCLPGNGRTVWWTGRVAIGLRHQPPQFALAASASGAWLQDLMLARRASA